jgi:IPT/TIG domain
MQRANLNTPSERKKVIVAAVLGVVAILFLWWAFIGFGSSNNQPTQRATNTPSSAQGVRTVSGTQRVQPPAAEVKDDLLTQLEPVSYQQSPFSGPEPKRNIFAYYEPPKPAQSANTPTPTPTPTPPVMVAAVSPANVYARTSDFTLEVTGDKFSLETRIVVDGRELATRYQSPQQLTAVVPASMITTPGQRQVIVRSPDGKLYSNTLAFSVSAPPTPNYSYIGIIGDKHYSHDIALLQDKGNKELLNVQRGDVLGGRFRVTSISEKELVLTDTNLKIKHSIAMSSDNEKGLGPLARPTPKVDAEDDEP